MNPKVVNFIYSLIFLLYQFNRNNCENDPLPQKRSSYYKLFKAINNKICEESTIDGKLNYDNSILDKFDECAKLEAKMKISNDTYVYEKCQQTHYSNSTRNQIIWQTKCQWNLDKNEPYYECLNKNMIKPNMSGTLRINQMDLDIEQNLEMLNCFKSALNVSLNASNDHEVMGDYGFNKFELSTLFKYNKQLLCDKYLRNKSYKKENEAQKVEQYFGCLNLLSSDCLDKMNFYNENISLTNYYNTTYDDLYCNYYEHRFDLSVEAITHICLFGQMKIKHFYSSQLIDKLKTVVECQKESLKLSDDEKDIRLRRDNYLKFLYTNYY